MILFDRLDKFTKQHFPNLVFATTNRLFSSLSILYTWF